MLSPAYEVRREVMFSQVCVCSTFEGAVPHPADGEYLIPGPGGGRGTPFQFQSGKGTPSQFQAGGYRIQLRGLSHPADGGVTPSSWQGGYPIPVPGGGVPHPAEGSIPHPGLDGIPHVQTWDGVLPH